MIPIYCLIRLHYKILFNIITTDLKYSEEEMEKDLNNLKSNFQLIDKDALFTPEKFNIFRRYGNPVTKKKIEKFKDSQRLNNQNLAIKEDRVLLLELLTNGITLLTKLRTMNQIEGINSTAQRFNQ